MTGQTSPSISCLVPFNLSSSAVSSVARFPAFFVYINVICLAPLLQEMDRGALMYVMKADAS